MRASPALDAWRRRGTDARDGLWVAACYEQQAGEAEAQGMAESAATARQNAQAVVKAARACTDQRCDHAGSNCLRWQEIARAAEAGRKRREVRERGAKRRHETAG